MSKNKIHQMSSNRQRRYDNDHAHHPDDDDDDDDKFSGCGLLRFEYTVIMTMAAILLLGTLALSIFWIIQYRGGFALFAIWQRGLGDLDLNVDPQRQFNLHPVLMTAGFVTFSGFSILFYRLCRCCRGKRRIYVKLLHAIFNILATPCIGLGFYAVYESHNRATPPIPNFYSLHSWLGLVAMALFAIQFCVGFFSFLILLCCEGATASCRAGLVPVHASFGLLTFFLACAAALTGLTEKALFTLGSHYQHFIEEGVVMNAMGVSLIALIIVIGYALLREDYRYRSNFLIRSSGGDI